MANISRRATVWDSLLGPERSKLGFHHPRKRERKKEKKKGRQEKNLNRCEDRCESVRCEQMQKTGVNTRIRV